MTTHKWLPSEPNKEMLEAERFASSLAYESHEVQAVEVYKAMWQSAPEVEQEHVITKNDNGLTLSVDFDFLPVGTKFYTNPQPNRSEQSLDMVKRQPLSEVDELMDIWEEMEVPISFAWLHEIARAIEKAHGIGVE